MPAPAQAHSVLLGTDPEDGAQLAGAPETVSLTFNEDITELGTEVVITTEDGEDVTRGETQINGPVVSQDLTEVRPAGAYTVTWRAVSADGHPISGTFAFTAAEDVGAAPDQAETDPATEETPEDDPGPAASEDDQEPDTGDVTATDAADADAAEDGAEADSGMATSTWIIIGIIIAAVIVIASVLARNLGAAKRDE